VLKPLGCRFTVARFEGAPGAFDFLRMLAPDYVKFSPRVVMAIERGGLDAAKALHAGCAALGIQTIAEYVESEPVLRELQGIGVHYAQGFAIQAPRALADM
jgi:EAL domain-containing protein (putative c-di-GMP-specific phosphodiesterase class I)